MPDALPDGRRRFAGRVAIVTGSSGRPSIGYACAERLVAEGASVVLNGRSPERLREAAEHLGSEGGQVTAVEGAAEAPGVAEALVAEATDRYGGVDLVVNTVGGTLTHASWRELELEALAGTYVLNTWPMLRLVQAALDGGLGAGGAVVNISSGAPYKTTPSAAAYAAAKAGLNALTRTLASDLAGRAVRVNAVSPGLTRTSGTRRAWADDDGAAAAGRLPLGRLTEAEDVADAVCFLLSDDARQITGVVLDVDGGNHLFGGGWTPYGNAEGDHRH